MGKALLQVSIGDLVSVGAGRGWFQQGVGVICLWGGLAVLDGSLGGVFVAKDLPHRPNLLAPDIPRGTVRENQQRLKDLNVRLSQLGTPVRSYLRSLATSLDLFNL